MNTYFPKSAEHKPNFFIIDANNKILGRIATQISKLLRGKETNFFTNGIDLGNYVFVINAQKVKVSGSKDNSKIYYRFTNRPGNLKQESFNNYINRLPHRVLEKAVWGMLPKGKLGRKLYKRLYVFKDDKIKFKNKIKINNYPWTLIT